MWPDWNPVRMTPKPKCLSTELPAPVVGLDGASGFEHGPSQDLPCVSLSAVNWESNPWRDAVDFLPLLTELRQYPPRMTVPRLRMALDLQLAIDRHPPLVTCPPQWCIAPSGWWITAGSDRRRLVISRRQLAVDWRRRDGATKRRRGRVHPSKPCSKRVRRVSRAERRQALRGVHCPYSWVEMDPASGRCGVSPSSNLVSRQPQPRSSHTPGPSIVASPRP